MQSQTLQWLHWTWLRTSKYVRVWINLIGKRIWGSNKWKSNQLFGNLQAKLAKALYQALLNSSKYSAILKIFKKHWGQIFLSIRFRQFGIWGHSIDCFWLSFHLNSERSFARFLFWHFCNPTRTFQLFADNQAHFAKTALSLILKVFLFFQQDYWNGSRQGTRMDLDCKVFEGKSLF